MWFWWMSYEKVRAIDREIASVREELKAVYTKLRDLVALRKYHKDNINLHTHTTLTEDYKYVQY